MKNGIEYKLKFNHPVNGEVIFSSEINNLNGNKMYWFSYSTEMFAGTLSDIKTIVHHIRNGFTVISDNFEFIKKVSKNTWLL